MEKKQKQQNSMHIICPVQVSGETTTTTVEVCFTRLPFSPWKPKKKKLSKNKKKMCICSFSQRQPLQWDGSPIFYIPAKRCMYTRTCRRSEEKNAGSLLDLPCFSFCLSSFPLPSLHVRLLTLLQQSSWQPSLSL